MLSKERFVCSAGECGVEVYQLGMDVLVVLKAEGEPHNGIKDLAWAIREEILKPEGLRGADLHWVYWDCRARAAHVVVFRQEGPEWWYLTPEEFSRIIAAFESPDPLQELIEQGALDLESWVEEAQEEQKKRLN